MKKTSNSEPKLLSISHNRLRQRLVTVAIDVEKTDEGYAYSEVTLQPGTISYDGIVSQLITSRYPSDKMQAIINNYLADPSDEAILQEFSTMQTWRKEAKNLAKKILAELEK